MAMKNGHIKTAIKALEKQHKKFIEQSNIQLAKANQHASNQEFYMQQAKFIYKQIEALQKGEPIDETSHEGA